MTAPVDLAIETHGLIRAFGGVRAVDHLDLAVPAGGVYGVLGPNGAGKTTAIRLLSTLLLPDAGRAVVLGHDVVTEAHQVRARISLTRQFASVDRDLTGWENLVLAGRLLGLGRARARTRADELLDAFELGEAARRQVRHYSGGMLRRLDIAASIAVVPDLLFLDEPTTGLDPRSRGQVWDIVRALVTNGSTVVLTTQYLDEADKLADRIAVIDHGRVIAEGTSDDLKASVGAGTLQIRLADAAQHRTARRILADMLPGPVEASTGPASLAVPVPAAALATAALSRLAEAGVEVLEFGLGRPSLDEVFLALTGHGRPDGEPTPSGTSSTRTKKEVAA